MPQTTMDYWVIAGVVIAGVTLVAALRSPKIRKKLGLNVTGSKRVDANISKSAEADVTVTRSEDVRVKIGD